MPLDKLPEHLAPASNLQYTASVSDIIFLKLYVPADGLKIKSHHASPLVYGGVNEGLIPIKLSKLDDWADVQ